MTIELAKDVESFVKEQARSANSKDPDALVNDLLRSLREQQRQTFEISSELEEWLLKAADTSASPLASTDFDAIRQKARARTKSSS